MGVIRSRCVGKSDTERPYAPEAYADLYAQVLAKDRLCLSGMLAADYRTLPGSMRHSVIRFLDRVLSLDTDSLVDHTDLLVGQNLGWRSKGEDPDA